MKKLLLRNLKSPLAKWLVSVLLLANQSLYAQDTQNLTGEGTSESPYQINTSADFSLFVTMVNDNSNGEAASVYQITDDITLPEGSETVTTTFSGTFDGGLHTISGLNKPLFTNTSGAVIKNVILKNVTITQDGYVGAIAAQAGGYTRIYNCGILPTENTFENETSALKSNDKCCGGLVGLLKDDSRVVNCYSYATICGGDTVGGIVGYNQFASTAAVSSNKYTQLRTMVVNCMFYGDITGGTYRYPVYGGIKILNTGSNGINNYNYYRGSASVGTLTDNNCSWPATEENLTRFEYYRSILNSNRELCGWWVKSDVAPNTLTKNNVEAIGKDASLIKKWVLDPSIAPYPILKDQGIYPSVINQDQSKRTDPETKEWVGRATGKSIETLAVPDTAGQILGTVQVTITAGSNHSGSGSGSESRTISITAMDTQNNDNCYGKIQLPYYNEVFGNPQGSTWEDKYAGNYTGMVVTGWKITSVTGGTEGDFTPDWQDGYNFADRHCTEKDLFGTSGRVFAQGGYYYVPDGVTAITIEAYWGKAKYLCNNGRRYDIITDKTFNAAGQRPQKFPDPTTSDDVYTGINPLLTAFLNAGDNTSNGKTVYDNAVVLVGNYQLKDGVNQNFAVRSGDNRVPFTMMSADLDFDNEPDYCLVLQKGQRTTRYTINPVRFDFLPVIEMGTAMKQDGTKFSYGLGTPLLKGHFEITETAFLHLIQLEYDNRNHQGQKAEAPLIINGGRIEQVCTSENDVPGNFTDRTSYIILGGHLKMDAFSPGTHINRQYKNRHCAVNVIGGEIDNLYLSGIYRQDITANNDNPHCYIDGGRFSQVVSGGKEPIDGDVTFTIDHSLIKEFYGGGINSAKPVTGSISVTVDRSRIDKFCGGPMFGDMTEGKTVTTNATGSTFGVFYGAGNGGTNYAQVAQDDNKGNTEWTTNAEWGLDGYTKGLYDADNDCYLAKYEFQIFNLPAGDVEGRDNRRWYRYGAQFAATNTGSVTSTLTDCIVEGDFYGAGNLGGVIGDATSTLTGHTVIEGSAFGAGYSASIEPFQVLTKSNYRLPSRNPDTGTIDEGDVGDSEEYIWTNETSLGGETLSTDNPMVTVDGVNYMYTTKSLLNLGTVTGQVTLKLEEDAQVMGNVFGGGNESTVSGNTSVVMKDRSTAYNVFGGGNKADVSGSVSVKIQGGTVSNDVYGGGALANTNVSGNPSDTTGVILTGGTVTNDVYGGGLGDALHAAIVYGDVTLSLNGTSERDLVADDAKGAIVRRLFGCNNINGTPKGNVTVYVSGTQDRNTSSIKEKTDNQFDIDAVYGGGNLADYIPANPATSITNVIVEGCQRSRIRDVYGGGNAAAVSGTHVIVRGADSIDFVFGGGNGKDNIIVNGEETVNPGADIGIRKLTAAEDPTDFILFDDPKYLYADTTGNSIGTATVTFLGGNVNHIFGGSNTKGDVIKQAKVILGDENLDYCRFQVREVYGGANEAYMSGKASIEMKCVTGMEEIYGGARMADVEGGIELTITGGTYKKVFGGNNISGRINGPIKVNIEQTGCLPIIIEELYGGGNLAPYSIYGYLDEQEEGEDGISRYKPRKEKASGDDAIEYPDPEINIVSCERIDVVYGGGYKAAMVGSPTININMITGWTDGTDPNTSDLNQPHDMSDIGEIGDVFGGGNQAEVTGSTNVKIGTKETVTVHNIEKRVYTGILADSERVTAAPGYGASDTDRKSLTITVEGANITGNVYGGGNEADVTGDTNIQIGRSTQ